MAIDMVVTHHLSHTHTTLSHTICHTPSFTHTTLSHTLFHTQLCHTPSLTHNFVTHRLSHTLSFTHNFVTHPLSHTHTQLCHTPSFTHNFVTHPSFTHNFVAPLFHTLFVGRRGTCSQKPSFCMAGVELGDIRLGFAWEAWHLCHWWRAWAPLVARGATALCVAGVALAHINRRFAWQMRHLLTPTFVSHGRQHLLCHWAGSGGALGRRWSPLVARDAAALCVAGVALAHSNFRLPWQVWNLRVSTLASRGRRAPYASGLERLGAVSRAWGCRTWQAWHLLTSTLVLRRACSQQLSFCVAGVALAHILLDFAWQACHLCHWAGSGGALGHGSRPWRRGTLRGKRCACSHQPSFCVAGGKCGTSVTGLDLVARLGTVNRPWRRGTLSGSHQPSFCVADAALADTILRFAWQAWQLCHWAGSGGALGRR